jgi:hypothetical protein
MSEKTNVFSQDDNELRQLNLATVEKYMNMNGPRLNRYKLFTDDCQIISPFTEYGEPETFSGIEQVAQRDKDTTEIFPDWTWSNVKIFQTQDLNYFWVECDGGGQAFLPGHPPAHHSDHFIHSFQMENGKIKVYREFRNPVKELMDFGLEIPHLKK